MQSFSAACKAKRAVHTVRLQWVYSCRERDNSVPLRCLETSLCGSTTGFSQFHVWCSLGGELGILIQFFFFSSGSPQTSTTAPGHLTLYGAELDNQVIGTDVQLRSPFREQCKKHGALQGRCAWSLRMDDTLQSRSVVEFFTGLATILPTWRWLRVSASGPLHFMGISPWSQPLLRGRAVCAHVVRRQYDATALSARGRPLSFSQLERCSCCVSPATRAFFAVH